jgi:hypothetical protein
MRSDSCIRKTNLKLFNRARRAQRWVFFSIAVERTAMENHSVPALCAGTGKARVDKL